MISVICVYNDKKILEDFLLKTLLKQTVNYELISVDNTGNKFVSAAQALNQAGERAKGDNLMFVHQDVDLVSDDFLAKAENLVNEIRNLGVAGIAGVGGGRKGLRTNIVHGKSKKPASKNRMESSEKVQTIDECLVIIPKDVFKRFKFDEELCDGWHLYAVDLCLRLNKANLGVYVIPLSAYHGSLGTLNVGYVQTLKRILERHKLDQKYIHTSCGKWATFLPLLPQILLVRVGDKLKRIAKRMYL